MTPSIHLEKVDTPTLKQDGQEQADRDDSKQALKMDADNIGITFIITNTSKTDPATGDGAWYKASDLNLDDSTIVGDAHVDMDSLTYPADWDTLVLKPGESVSVTGTLKGVKEGETHTDRAIVTGTPLVECAPSNGDPFNDKTDGGEDTDPEYCAPTPRPPATPTTGTATVPSRWPPPAWPCSALPAALWRCCSRAAPCSCSASATTHRVPAATRP